MNSIIKRLSVSPISALQRRIVHIEGLDSLPNPPSFLNVETDEAYCHIAGGVVPPRGLTGGYAVVIAVIKGPEEEQPRFKILEEAEERNLTKLLRRCVELQEKYGYQQPGCEELFRPWHGGDFQAYSQMIAEFNQQLRKEKTEACSFLYSLPQVYEESGRVSFYLTLIGSLLGEKTKQLSIGPAHVLRNALTNTLPEASLKWTLETCPPPVLALGHAVYAMTQIKPWNRRVPYQINLSQMDDVSRLEYALWEATEGRERRTRSSRGFE